MALSLAPVQSWGRLNSLKQKIMNKIPHIFLFPMLLLFVHGEARAQETIRVATQKVEKSFKFNNRIGQIIIEAERGNIHIQGWDRDEVSVVLSISAKNTNMELAKKELGFVRYNLVKSRSNIFLNNKMTLPETADPTKISSVISARYDIRVPEEIYMVINDKFGSVTIRNTSGIITGDLQFCDMILQSYSGVIKMNISVGDLNCMQSGVTGNIKTKYANVSFTEVSGEMSVISRYGSFSLTYGEKLMDLTMDSYATDILISNKTCHVLDMKINGENCPLNISKDCYIPEKKFLQSTHQQSLEQPVWLLQYVPETKTPKLRIDARFGKISLL